MLYYISEKESQVMVNDKPKVSAKHSENDSTLTSYYQTLTNTNQQNFKYDPFFQGNNYFF